MKVAVFFYSNSNILNNTSHVPWSYFDKRNYFFPFF